MDFIESQSLQLIKTVLDHYSLPDYGRFLVERAVHATADFSIASLFVIQPGFIETSTNKIETGSEIYCDTEMVSSGISPRLLQQCGIKLTVFVHQQECYARACLLYTSDAADDQLCVDLGGRRNIKKKKKNQKINPTLFTHTLTLLESNHLSAPHISIHPCVTRIPPQSTPRSIPD